MKTVITFLFMGALLSATPIATQVKLVNAGSPLENDGHYYVSPYTLSVDGHNYAAMCVDFLHDSEPGDKWDAYLSPVSGDISNTYHPGDAIQYEEEAYLFSLIVKSNADRVDIQHAAWSITDPGYTADAAAQTYVTLAQNNYSGMNFSGYELVSSTTKPYQQEYLIYAPEPVAAPEPGSLPLLATGLLLAAAGMIQRKKRKATVATR